MLNDQLAPTSIWEVSKQLSTLVERCYWAVLGWN